MTCDFKTFDDIHTLFSRSLCCRSATRSHTCRNLMTKFVLISQIETNLEELGDINTSFALFNASAKAEFGSTGAAGGGGTLLKACIASAIFQHVKKKRNVEGRPQSMMVYLIRADEPQDTQCGKTVSLESTNEY